MTLLSVRDLTVRHGQLAAVTDFNIDVEEGQKIAVIGANGAGKSSLLRALAGVLKSAAGSVLVDGVDITDMASHRRVSAGVALVPEGRRLFKSLTVEENLKAGQYLGRPGPWTTDTIYALFPWMADRRRQNAQHLSGGEQQSVAIGRALMTNPRLLLIDELSLGLSPAIVQRIYGALLEVVDAGCSILLVEQDVSQALDVADHVHCLLEGRTVLQGLPSELTMAEVEQAYFGVNSQMKVE